MGLEMDFMEDLSLSEYNIKAEGYFLRLDRQWEQTRYLASYLHAKLTGKGISPQKLYPLVFDEDDKPYNNMPKREVITKEEVKAFEKKWLKGNLN